jgi:hypothetical protein
MMTLSDPRPVEVVAGAPEFGELTQSSAFVTGNRLLSVMTNVKPMKINWPVKKFEVLKIPIPSSLTAQDVKSYRTYIEWSSRVYGILRLSQSLLVLRSAMGPLFEQNPLIRNLKFYVTKSGATGGRDKRGEEEICLKDSLAPTRILVLVHGAFIYHTAWLRKMKRILPVILEIVRYIFVNPFENSVKLKKCSAMGFQMVSAKARGGRRFEWAMNGMDKTFNFLFDYEERDVNKPVFVTNDEEYFKALEKEYNDERKVCREVCPTLDQWFRDMLFLEPEKAIKEMVIVRGAYVCAGFLRSDLQRSLVDQLTAPILNSDEEKLVRHFLDPEGKLDGSEIDVLLGDLSPLQENLKVEWSNIMSLAHERKAIMNEKEFIRSLASRVTSKSASVTPIRKRVPTSKGVYNISFGDKRAFFYLLGKKILNREELNRQLTEKYPGRTSTRQTPLRLTRGIFMLSVYIFAYEQILWRILSESMERKVPTNYRFGTASDFTLATTSGNILRDHAIGLHCTGRGYALLFLMDYSQFDSHQKFHITRKQALSVILGKLKELNYRGKFLDFPDLGTLINELWGKGKRSSAHFAIKSVVSGEPTVVVKFDALASGEQVTIYFNNVTNRAMFRDFLKIRDSLSGVAGFRRVTFQGDDTFSVYEIGSVPKATQIRERLENLNFRGLLGGQQLNVIKTVARIFYYEYLKVTALYGMLVPLLHMTPFTTERDRTLDESLEVTRGYVSFMRTMANRGVPEAFCFKIVLYTWLLRSYDRTKLKAYDKIFLTDDVNLLTELLSKGINIKLRTDETEGNLVYKVGRPKIPGFTLINSRSLGSFLLNPVSSRYYYPVGCVFAPSQFGGGGLIPQYGNMRTSDLITIRFCHEDPVFCKYVNSAITVMKMLPKQSISEEVVDVLKRDAFKPGIKMVEGSLEHWRVQLAKEAEEKLLTQNIKVGRLSLSHYAEFLVEQQIPNIKAFKPIKFDERAYLNSVRIEKLRLSDFDIYDVRKEYGWIGQVEMVKGKELIKIKKHCPFVYLDESLQQTILTYGSGYERNTIGFNKDVSLRRLNNDSTFANRQITEDMLFRFLSNPRIGTDVNKIVLSLLAMGYDQVAAMNFAKAISGNKLSWYLGLMAHGFSVNDGFMNMLRMGPTSVSRIVGTSPFPASKTYDIIKLICVLKSLYEGMWSGKHFEYKPILTNKLFDSMALTLKGVRYLMPESIVHPFLGKPLGDHEYEKVAGL